MRPTAPHRPTLSIPSYIHTENEKSFRATKNSLAYRAISRKMWGMWGECSNCNGLKWGAMWGATGARGAQQSKKECDMKYPFEQQAMQNLPMPDGLTTYEKQIYIVLRNLYYALRKGTITQQQAQKEKNAILKELDDLNATREFERKCWEASAKQTMAADHALMMYRQNRTLENADILVDRLEWLHDECALPVSDDRCPICGESFSQEHASQKPAYCEKCGCRLKWEVSDGN